MAIEYFQLRMSFEQYRMLLMYIVSTTGNRQLLDHLEQDLRTLREATFGVGSKPLFDESEKEKFKEFADKYAFKIRTDVMNQQEKAMQLHKVKHMFRKRDKEEGVSYFTDS